MVWTNLFCRPGQFWHLVLHWVRWLENSPIVLHACNNICIGVWSLVGFRALGLHWFAPQSKNGAQHQHLRYPISSKEKRSFLSLSPAVLMSCLLATKLLAAASLECLNDGHVSKKLWPPDIHQHFYSKKSINRLILSEYYSAPCYFSCNIPFTHLYSLWKG